MDRERERGGAAADGEINAHGRVDEMEVDWGGAREKLSFKRMGIERRKRGCEISNGGALGEWLIFIVILADNVEIHLIDE